MAGFGLASLHTTYCIGRSAPLGDRLFYVGDKVLAVVTRGISSCWIQDILPSTDMYGEHC